MSVPTLSQWANPNWGGWEVPGCQVAHRADRWPSPCCSALCNAKDKKFLPCFTGTLGRYHPCRRGSGGCGKETTRTAQLQQRCPSPQAHSLQQLADYFYPLRTHPHLRRSLRIGLIFCTDKPHSSTPRTSVPLSLILRAQRKPAAD